MAVTGHVQTAEVTLPTPMAALVTQIRVTVAAGLAIRFRPSMMLDAATSAVRKVHAGVYRGSAAGTPTATPPTAVFRDPAHAGIIDVTDLFTVEHLFTAEPGTPGTLMPPGIVPVNPVQNWFFDWFDLRGAETLSLAVRNLGASTVPGCRFGFEFEVM